MQLQDIEDIYELTPSQRGMFFMSALGSHGDLLVEQLTCRLPGMMAVADLQRAMYSAVQAFAILRASFHLADDDHPVQIIHRSVNVPWRVLDHARGAPRDFEPQLRAVIQDERARPFSLEEAPLMRVCLVRRPDGDLHLIWTHHHLLLDGWSLIVVVKHILQQCNGGAQAASPAGCELREFIAWLQQRDAEADKTFWGDRLSCLVTPTSVGTTSRSSANMGAVQEIRRQLPAPVVDRMSRLSGQHRVTASALLQSAWTLVLAKHGERTEIAFGATMSGRPSELPGISNAAGLFINTVPIVVTLDERMSCAGLWSSMTEEALAVSEHQYTDPRRLSEYSGLGCGEPLFESLFVLENFPQNISFGGITVTEVELHGGETSYPFTLVIDPESNYTFRVIYDTRKLTESEASDLVDAFIWAADEMTRSPDSTVEAILRQLQIFPVKIQANAARQRVAPRNEIEFEVWAIWKGLLGTSEFGVQDDFFEIGGNSLLAAQAMSRVRRSFGEDIPLQVVFSAGSTVENLSEALVSYLLATMSEAELEALNDKLEAEPDIRGSTLRATGEQR